MWQRFSERARRIVFYAQEEASKLGNNCVETEHLLLGLVREPDCTAVKILGAMGVSAYHIRTEIENQVMRVDFLPEQDMQLTVGAKRVLDLAYDEAKSLNNEPITSKHLLLGLIREGNGMAGRVLQKLGVDIDLARHEAANLQDIETTKTRPSTAFDTPAMRNEARIILTDIIKEYGASIHSDHERCKDLLWERRDAYTREIIALQLVLQAGIVEELISTSETKHTPLFTRLSEKAAELTPIDRTCAMWAVISWAVALGMMKGKDEV